MRRRDHKHLFVLTDVLFKDIFIARVNSCSDVLLLMSLFVLGKHSCRNTFCEYVKSSVLHLLSHLRP